MVYYAITPKFKAALPNITRYVSERESHYRVYELLRTYDLADEQEAIEASSWCELAEIGETYETDNFKIEVIDDDD